MKKTEWSKDSTIFNETINVPRKSMKAIVMLFTNKTKTDSEEYVYPNIEKVRVTVEGVPNAVYSQGIPKTRLYEEVRRLFGTGEIQARIQTVAKVARATVRFFPPRIFRGSPLLDTALRIFKKYILVI